MRNLNLIKNLLSNKLSDYLVLDKDSVNFTSAIFKFLAPTAVIGFEIKKGFEKEFFELFSSTYPEIHCYNPFANSVYGSNRKIRNVYAAAYIDKEINLNEAKYDFIRDYKAYAQSCIGK